MSVFWSCVRAETLKLTRRAKYYVFPALLLIIYALLLIFPQLNKGNQAAGILFTLGGAGGMALGTLILKAYLPLMAFMGACDLFASEIKQKSVRACVMLPVGRVTLCLAKCAAVFIVGAAGALIITLIDTLIGIIPSIEALGEPAQLVMLIVDLVPFACMVMFAVLINMIARAPAFSMLLCIVLYIALLVIGPVYGITSCLFTGYLAWHSLIIGYTLPLKALLPRVLCVVCTLAAFSALNVLLFERMEL